MCPEEERRKIPKEKRISKEFLLPWSFERHDLINYLQMAMGHIGLVDGDLERDIRKMSEQLKISQGYLIQQKVRHKPLDVETNEPFHPELDIDVEKSKLLSETKAISKRIKKVLRRMDKYPTNEHLNKGRTFLENANKILGVQLARLQGKPLPLRETELRKVIEKVVEKHRGTADFEIDLDPQADMPVLDLYFERVLDNLIVNSKKAFGEWEGKIGDKPRITIRTSRSNSDVILHISDNGPGFKKEVLERDPFKLGVTSKAKEEGGGTGLAIVKHIVESHGGTIRIIDKGPGRGAHFEIRFKKPKG